MNWKPLARRLAAGLEESGDLVSGQWSEAFESTPRHAFVPAFYRNMGGAPSVWRELGVGDGPDWLEPIYTNVSLVTRLDPRTVRQVEGGWTGVPTSSSTQPSLTARMLEALGVEPGHTVLDAGTGTGYQAALLAHRLGTAGQLTTADIDPELTASAKGRLEELGYAPVVVACDVTVHPWQQFDRVIVTCGLSRITESLRAAVAPGGRLIANVGAPLGSGLVVLDADGEGVLEGRFHPGGGSFMPARTDRSSYPRTGGDAQAAGEEGPAGVPADVFLDYHFAFLLAVHLPGVQVQYGTDDQGQAMRRLVVPGGSSSETVYPESGPAYYRETGDHGLWPAVERCWSWFVEHGQPSWDRFGLTVTPDGQRLWFETPKQVVVQV
ncbi:protein-L-isoaspartate(D-aspartate) O-methyltransferase [Streptomyces albireticuli]|uniref:Protein-L-isoaspartate O-methyltransferase n=1 Tax=Streptomyces albireticuli TaxID=1940 RepID=A0A2A2D4Y6_9ACTN|nr:protein-L-isoaspartate(D-aspartate) O-methyltransferase [Streptomyces albireticuli]